MKFVNREVQKKISILATQFLQRSISLRFLGGHLHQSASDTKPIQLHQHQRHNPGFILPDPRLPLISSTAQSTITSALSTFYSELYRRMRQGSLGNGRLFVVEMFGEVGFRAAAGFFGFRFVNVLSADRSEERRVGKECRSRW